MSDKLELTIIGRGKVGTGLWRWFEECGVDARLVSSRAFVPARTSGAVDREGDSGEESSGDEYILRVAILAVPDGAIESLAGVIHARFDVLLHCAGSLGPEAFGALPSQRDGLGVFHPLISFASKEHPPPRRGPAFAIAGDELAREVAARLVQQLGGMVLTREDGASALGPRYHAAAALLANGAAALSLLSRDILDSLEVEALTANAALAALLESVAHNVRTLGMPDALTGPIARGNADTVAAHLEALSGARELHRAYTKTSALILEAARQAGLDEVSARAIEGLLIGR